MNYDTMPILYVFFIAFLIVLVPLSWLVVREKWPRHRKGRRDHNHHRDEIADYLKRKDDAP